MLFRSVGESPEEFARGILRLLDDPQERERLGANGRRAVETWLSWDALGGLLLGAYDDLASGAPV